MDSISHLVYTGGRTPIIDRRAYFSSIDSAPVTRATLRDVGLVPGDERHPCAVARPDQFGIVNPIMAVGGLA